MYLSRFTLPRGARYRVYLDAQLDQDSEAVAVETTSPIKSSFNELSSRLKHLCPLPMVTRLNDCSDTDGTRLVLDFADYLAACGPQQRCQCEENPDCDVSMGTWLRDARIACNSADWRSWDRLVKIKGYTSLMYHLIGYVRLKYSSITCLTLCFTSRSFSP